VWSGAHYWSKFNWKKSKTRGWTITCSQLNISTKNKFFFSSWLNLYFYNNCPISRALIGSFLSSIRVQTDKLKTCTRQVCLSRHLTSVGSCYCKKQINISFLCVCPLIEDKFRHNIVKVCCGSSLFHSLWTLWNQEIIFSCWNSMLPVSSMFSSSLKNLWSTSAVSSGPCVASGIPKKRKFYFLL